MTYKDIEKLAKAIDTMARTIPVSHPSHVEAFMAKDKIDGFMVDAIALEKSKAVREHISQKDPSELDSKDKAALADADRSIKFREKALEEAAQLKAHLDRIAIDFHLQKAAKMAGALNEDLACKAAKQLGSIDVDEKGNASFMRKMGATGNLFEPPQPLDMFIKSLAKDPEYAMLFSPEKAQQAQEKSGQEQEHSGPNPFMKGPGFNLTEQGRIYKQDKALAARLQEEARQAEGKPSYDEISNPWKPGSLNLTAQGKIYKEDRARAKRLAAEAGVNL